MSRLDKDQYFLKVCEAAAERSTCIKAKVGSIIVSEFGEIRSTGYNGAAKGWPHCIDVGCILDADKKCVRSTHAEINAMIQATSTHGLTLYCTHTPCQSCALYIINAGIARVVYSHVYIDPKNNYINNKDYPIVLDWFAFSGIKVEYCQLEGETNDSNS